MTGKFVTTGPPGNPKGEGRIAKGKKRMESIREVKA